MAITFVSRATGTLSQLTSPIRYTAAASAQTHAAGNLLVAVLSRSGGNHPISLITNTAGDLWTPSTRTPYLDAAGAHYHEVWYVLATKGAAADQLTFNFLAASAPTDIGFAVYEFAPGPGAAGLYTFQYEAAADAAASLGIDLAHHPKVNSGLVPTTVPSVVIAVYRALTPTLPSGVQAGETSTAGGAAYWDCYQAQSAPAAVTANLPDDSDPQWSVLATAFTLAGVGCPQDLPGVAGNAGAGGCAADLP